MSFDKYTNAMENMFDPEATVTTLLDSVRENVKTIVKTVDQATSLENKLSDEAAQFNNCLLTMSNAIRKCERGEISKEEALSDCAPCVAALKNKCVALTLSNAKIVGDDITEDEIAMLREYITGCKDIVADRKVELQDCSCASESFMDDYSVATEASGVAKSIRQSTDAKTAAECYKQAKKLYGVGSKDEAKKYLAKAKKLYEKCLATAKKHGKMKQINREASQRAKYGIGTVSEFKKTDTYKDTVAFAPGIGAVIDYFEDRIDACTALQLQWDNKAGKSTFKETKAQLKAERKAATKDYKFGKFKDNVGKAVGKSASRKAQKAANKRYKEMVKSAAESWEEYQMIEDNFEFIDAMESFAEDVLLECEMISAMEAEGDDGGKSEAEQKLEDLYVEFNKAKAEGNGEEMDRIGKQIESIVNQISKEASDAISEEDYAAAKRKTKKAIAIGTAVVAVAAGTAYGVKSGSFKALGEKAKGVVGKMKEKGGNEKKAATDGKNFLGTVKSALGTVSGKFSAIFKKKGKGKTAATPTEDSYIGDQTFEEFEESMEAFMDALEMELAMEAAMEAEGDEDEGAGKAAGLGSKIRSKLAKLKRGKKTGNEAEAREGAEEAQDAIEELGDAIDEAETPEEKKKLCKAVKVGLAAGATVLATVGVVKGAKKASSYADKLNADSVNGAELKKAQRLLLSVVSTARSVKENAKTLAKPFTAAGKAAKGTIDEVRNRRKNKKANESFLSDLAFGLEGVMVDGEDVDDDDFDELEGKAFDDEGMSEEATEAAIAVMMAEDGIDDSDLEFMF